MRGAAIGSAGAVPSSGSRRTAGSGATQAMFSARQSAFQRPRTQSCSGGPEPTSSGVFQRAQAAQPPPISTSLTTITLAGRGFTVTTARSPCAGRTETSSLPRLYVRASIGVSGARSSSVVRACFGSRSCSRATSSRTMLPTIESQPFVAHLREPAAQLVAGEADRAAGDDQVAGEPAADDRAGGVGGGAPAVLRTEQVERGQRGDDLGGRREKERLVGVIGRAAAGRRCRRPARTSKAKLFAGRPEPRRIAATAAGNPLGAPRRRRPRRSRRRRRARPGRWRARARRGARASPEPRMAGGRRMAGRDGFGPGGPAAAHGRSERSTTGSCRAKGKPRAHASPQHPLDQAGSAGAARCAAARRPPAIDGLASRLAATPRERR